MRRFSLLRRFCLGGMMLLPAAKGAFAAEPMMDTTLLVTTRMGALNAVKAGDFTQALKQESLALKIAQDQNGPTSPSLTPLFNDKGVLEWHLAQYREAEQDFKWGLALLEKNLGLEDPKAADSLDLLAALYMDTNRLEEARVVEKRALALRKAAGPGNLPSLAHSQELLGRIELGLHNGGESLTLWQEAQKNLSKFSNPDPAFSILLWKDQASAYDAQEISTQTQSCLEKALETAQRGFAADSPEAAEAMLDLGNFDRGHGEKEKGRSLDQSALKIAQRFVGTNYDYQALPHMKRLSRAYRSVGNAASAVEMGLKVLQAETSVFGPQHPRVALDLMALAQAESDLDQKEKAKADLKKALALLRNFFPGDHPLVLRAQRLLESPSGKQAQRD